MCSSAHDRIIWDVAWAHDGSFFATGSRDRFVKTWRHTTTAAGEAWVLAGTLPRAADSVTALAWAPGRVQGRFVLALGLEAGAVEILASADGVAWDVLTTAAPGTAPAGCVNRLAWQPRASGRAGGPHQEPGVEAEEGFVLAVASADHSLRLLRLAFD